MPSQVPRVQSDILNALALSHKQRRETKQFLFLLIHEPNIWMELQPQAANVCYLYSMHDLNGNWIWWIFYQLTNGCSPSVRNVMWWHFMDKLFRLKRRDGHWETCAGGSSLPNRMCNAECALLYLTSCQNVILLHVTFFLQTFMLWIYYFLRNYLWCKLCWLYAV